MEFKALSLDPGVTTGYCYAEMREGRLCLSPGEVRFTMFDIAALLESFIKSGGQHIVYEDFQFRNAVRTGVNLTPVKVIGIIELYAGQYEPLVSFTCQQPSAQGDRGFYTDSKLKELGVYWAHGRGHARSATKHMLHWLNFGPGGEHIDVNVTPMELMND